MSTATYSAAYLRSKKLYTFLPLLVFPFLTLFYWAIGIKMVFKGQTAQTAPQGMNTSLPDANLKDETTFSKLTYYKKAEDDSARIREQLKKDPYRSGELTADENAAAMLAMQGLGAPETDPKQKPVLYQGKTYTGKQQKHIIEKLKTLDSVLVSAASPQFEQKPVKKTSAQESASLQAAQMQKLDAIMADMQQSPQAAGQDPELAELNSMLEKILDIQHPDRLKDKLRAQRADGRSDAYPVSSASAYTPISTFGAASSDSLSSDPLSAARIEANGFFSLDEPVTASSDNAIKAVVHEQQTLVSGSSIKLRLTADIYIAGTLIPKGNFIYGTAMVNGERLLIAVESIRLNSSLFPVKLSVYDLDGQKGIYIPGSISRNVAKQSASQDIQSLSVGSLDTSLGAQAASAGIQAAKTLIGQKTKLVQVTVKAGYQILLFDTNAKPL